MTRVGLALVAPSLLAASLLGACSETGATPDAWQWSDAVVDVDASVDGAAVDAPPTIDGAGAAFVINEVAAEGDDFVELYNPGPDPAPLAGFALTDDDGGVPNVAEAVRFAADQVLPADGRLVIVANVDPAGTGPQTACAGLAAVCLHASWGIGGGGDTIYLLGAGDVERARAEYPPDATSSGESWSRLPDGSGGFALGRATPGAANAAP